MTLINPVHIAFVVAIALLVLGPKRLPEVARSLGHGMREFRETLNGGTRHDQTTPPAPESAAAAPAHAPSVDAIAPRHSVEHVTELAHADAQCAGDLGEALGA